MANLIENKEWSNVYQIENTDRVYANPGEDDDIANKQAQALLNRTAYLKDKINNPTDIILDLGKF